MTLTQTGRNVSGTFRLGSIEFPSTGGAVGTDDSLQLNATLNNDGVTIIVSWNLRMASNQMSGTICSSGRPRRYRAVPPWRAVSTPRIGVWSRRSRPDPPAAPASTLEALIQRAAGR